MSDRYYIMGIHAVEIVLQTQPSRIKKIYFIRSPKLQPRKKALLRLIEHKKIAFSYKTAHQLESIVDSASHQGVVALVKSSKKTFTKSAKANSLVLVLDNVMDPQNIGAILRLAECFAVDAVFIDKIVMSPTIAKVSCGASELVKIEKKKTLNAIATLKKAGYHILATAITQESLLFKGSFLKHKKLAIVVGSEGRGIKPHILKSCDKVCYIPMAGKIASLNVSQTVAVLLGQYYLS